MLELIRLMCKSLGRRNRAGMQVVCVRAAATSWPIGLCAFWFALGGAGSGARTAESVAAHWCVTEPSSVVAPPSGALALRSGVIPTQCGHGGGGLGMSGRPAVSRARESCAVVVSSTSHDGKQITSALLLSTAALVMCYPIDPAPISHSSGQTRQRPPASSDGGAASLPAGGGGCGVGSSRRRGGEA
jgi:hypothetical protein